MEFKSIPEFTAAFMDKYDSLIGNVARRYSIPNRYSAEDIKQYIAERISKILLSRQETNKIENPEKYFKSCIEFYCIEYQRMHGYVFDLPKRPRKNCEDDEKSARALGFKYLKDMTVEESNSLFEMTLDKSLTENIPHGPENPVWSAITGCLSKEEADVVGCIYMRGLTWAETSAFLNVPQSTCWFRKGRAVKKIFDSFCNMSGLVSENLKYVLRGDSSKLEELREASDNED